MSDDAPQTQTRKRARGSYAKFICFRCRERRIKCQLADDGSVVPSSDPQPPDKACQRCRQQGLECIVRKTTLGRPNLKKQRVLTPASSAPSVELELPSRSPSPDPDALVLLTLDEDQRSARTRSGSIKDLPSGVHMYGAVNRTFDLTSSFLGQDKRFASAIEGLKHKQPKPVQDILSEQVTVLLEEYLIWHRLYMPWLPSLLDLRKQITETTTPTSSAIALLALLALIALDVPTDRLAAYRSLRTELHCIVYHNGQKVLFTLPREEYAVIVLELVHNHKPLALLDSHQAAAHTLSGNLFGTLIHAMHQRLGMHTAARRLRARLQTHPGHPDGIEELVLQILRWCAVTMWRISLDLEEVETTRSEAYEPELELREAFEVAGEAIDRYSLDKCFFLFHVLRYHADDVIASREVTADSNNIPRLSEHVAAHAELRLQRRKAFDDGLTRFFFGQGRTEEGLVLSQLISIEQGHGYSSVLGLAMFYAIMAGSRAMPTNSKDKMHPLAQLSRYYTERVNQEAAEQKGRSATYMFLDQYGDLHIEALEKRLTDFINASMDISLNDIPYVGPARHTSSNILLACKEILENNAVRIKLEGTLHERVDMQLILFENAARQLEKMEADGGSPDAVARGSVFTACAKLIRSLHRIMWQWKRSYALGTTRLQGQQQASSVEPPIYVANDGTLANPFPLFDMAMHDFSSDGLFSDWESWPQLAPNDLAGIFAYDVDPHSI